MASPPPKGRNKEGTLSRAEGRQQSVEGGSAAGGEQSPRCSKEAAAVEGRSCSLGFLFVCLFLVEVFIKDHWNLEFML